MILAVASALTKHALGERKHICRHNKVPQSWQGFKFLLRDIYIPAYYVDHLRAKLENLKQGSKTMKEYYHDFKICLMFGGLNECMEDVMSRFMRGLNSEIQTLLKCASYSHICHLFNIAHNAEKQILLSANICKNNVT